MRSVLVLLLSSFVLMADSRMLGHEDMVNFHLSSDLREQIKSDLIEEMGYSVDQAKRQILNEISEEADHHRRFYITQVEEFTHQLKALQEEMSFLRELVVDANYHRNASGDVVTQLRKRMETLERDLAALQRSVQEEPQMPDIPQGGQKL